jgi:hypothetical protein
MPQPSNASDSQLDLMFESLAESFSAKLRDLSAELRLLDRGLKTNRSLDGAALREFRQAMDNVRLTAWTVDELLNARQSQKNPQAMISFLTAERLRRFSQMAKDLSRDLERNDTSWPAQAIENVEGSLTLLLERLRRVGEKGA